MSIPHLSNRCLSHLRIISRLARTSAALVAGISLFWTISVDAADLTWDSDPTTALVNDGPGNWDTTTNNWVITTNNVVTGVNTTWTNSNPDNAIFGNGGTAGLVKLTTGITVGNLTFNAVGTGSYMIGTSNGSALTLASAGSTITANVAGAIQVSLAGAGALTKAGAGTLTLSGANTYTGATLISGGTLKANGTAGNGALAKTLGITLSSGGTLLTSTADQINHTATMSLAGGTFNTGRTSQTLGALTLTAASTLDLGTGGGSQILSFGGGSTVTGGLLTISDWVGSRTGGGTDEILFANRLDATSLGDIQFTGFVRGATELASGEIVPVPEPATWIAGFLMVTSAVGAWRLRRGMQWPSLAILGR